MPETSLENLVTMLGASLGEAAAREVLEREARTLRLGANLTSREVELLLRNVERIDGAAGLAAKLTLSRLIRAGQGRITQSAFPAVMNMTPGTPAPSAQPTRAAPVRGACVPVYELVDLFAKSLGDQAAVELVRKSQTTLGFGGSDLTPDQAAALLDYVDRLAGVAGAVARFAKVRFLLKFGR